MKISVLTAVYPTVEEHSRGTPIWNTLDRFRERCEFTVDCSLAVPPRAIRRLVQPRSYLRYPGQVDTKFNPRIPARPLEYLYLPRLTRPVNGLLLSRAYMRRLRDERPDVLLAYRIFPDGYAAVRAGKQLGIPAVIGSRGSDLKLIPPQGLIRRHTIWAIRQADAVICVSRELAKIAGELGGDSVHYVRNGVDRGVFFPAPQEAARRALSLAEGDRWVVFTGNLLPLKGIPTLLEAVAKLRSEGEIWNAALIGEGRQQQELEGMAQRLGIADRVRFLGQLAPEQICRWLNAADVFCLPSLSEGMPNVVLEALACGRCVVGTRVGGVPDLIGPGNGILVDPLDTAGLAEALQTAARSQWDRERIAASADWSWENVAEETLEICAGVCQSHAKAARAGR